MAAVSAQDEALRLTPSECRVLSCLVSNAGRIVSHRELMEGMSSGNQNTSIGNLRSCISRLRNKIEVDPALPRVIITHRKLGYSFAGKEGARCFQNRKDDDRRCVDTVAVVLQVIAKAKGNVKPPPSSREGG